MQHSVLGNAEIIMESLVEKSDCNLNGNEISDQLYYNQKKKNQIEARHTCFSMKHQIILFTVCP
jgi:hypothetical protein